MSGHSKWATTHRQKEANDAKKGAAFTKLAAAITIAVKQGGGIGDPNSNFRLRLCIDKARQFNMPKENIQRAIDKGTGAGGGQELTEVLFEGFAPGGVAVLAEAVTDNKLRTAQQVRTILDKAGGSLGGSGSVSYLFTQKGQIIVKLGDKSVENAELTAIDLGADDLEAEDGQMVVFCDKEQTFELKLKLEQAGFEIESAELVMKPTAWVEVNEGGKREQVEKILGQLEELEDVTHIWTNYA